MKKYKLKAQYNSVIIGATKIERGMILLGDRWAKYPEYLEETNEEPTPIKPKKLEEPVVLEPKAEPEPEAEPKEPEKEPEPEEPAKDEPEEKPKKSKKRRR